MHEDSPGTPLIQRALRKIRQAIDTRHPWEQKRLTEKLRPLQLRIFEPEDLKWCLELYTRNERCGLPAFGREIYAEYLESPKHLVFIAEDTSGRAGTFGIHRIDEENVYISFVMVDPAIQKSGIGTTMLTAAIALLEPKRTEQNIFLTANPRSMPFYRQLGYEEFHEEEMRDTKIIYACLGSLSASLIADCRDMLAGARVKFPAPPILLPIAESPLPQAPLAP
jgi:ribosomal protein S18 acetylase RimI-like enzyme